MDGDFHVAAWEVQPRLNTVSKTGRTVRIEPKIMEVLVCLAEHSGDLVEKERLIQSVWPDTFVTDDVLTRAISELRGVFGDDPRRPQFIETIPKRGYRLIAPVKALTPDPSPAGRAEADTAPVSHPSPRRERVSRLVGPGEGVRRYKWAAPMATALVGAALVFLALDVAGLRERLFPRPVPPAGKVRLVVLPFDNLSGDPEQEFFSDGITEEMTAQIARLNPQRLAVIGRASAMTYKGHRKSIDEIGQELSVQYVLEGSVRRAGDRVRIAAQLIKVGGQTHVWAEQYDRDLHDILAVQADVAHAVAQGIDIELTPQQRSNLARRYTPTPEAHEAYLRGRYFWNRRTPADIERSLQYFQQAIQLDPGYPMAYAGLADSLIWVDGERAKATARRALELDGTLGEAHATIGFAQLQRDRDWTGPQIEFQRAFLLNPNYPTAHHWYAGYLEAVGRREEAIAELRRALELDPLSLIIRSALAQTLSDAGRNDEALEQIRKVLEQDSSFARGHGVLGTIYGRKGMVRAALSELRKAEELGVPQGEVMADIGCAYAIAGMREDAEKTIARIRDYSRRTGASNADGIARINAILGDKDHAFAWLDKALDQHEGAGLSLNSDPAYTSLRSDPRFQDLLRRMNFPQ